MKKIYTINLDEKIVEKFKKVCGKRQLSSTINYLLYGVVAHVEQQKKKKS